MSLSLYNKKRNFKKTAEPKGTEKDSIGSLRFVVQKHDASTLHYDFRLEMDGVLKSWAVPKGPSLNPADKRLAVMVEDHPYDYRNFEGVIPAGEYGGGTVIVWDEGTYESANAGKSNRKEQEEKLLQELGAGKVSFVLHGKKLQGEYTLLKMKGRGDKTWMLIKKSDDWSSEEDISQNETSVLSGKTLEKVAAKHGTTVNHPHEKKHLTNKTVVGRKQGKSFASTKKNVAKKAITKTAKHSTKTSGKRRNVDKANDQVINLNGNEVTITNLQKIYWPKEGFRKGDMINYYLQIAPYILPYLLDRPHSLNRHPGGIAAANFFQKDVRGKVTDWIETFSEFSESTNTTVDYLVCSNEATLIYMANLGCIEMNPWHARTQHYLKPDWCLIDLDPDKSNSFDEVVDVANSVKAVLDAIAIGDNTCVKTSGSTGIHIYIPLGAKYDFDDSKNLAEGIATVVNKAFPNLTSMERTPAKRNGKIYLDFLQNKETQTAAAPYSLRPKPGIPVSTPLDWSEVRRGLTPTTGTAKNILERIKSEGDLFKPVLGKGIDLKSALQKLQSLLDR